MNAITLKYPDSWLMPIATDASHFPKDAKMAAAVKLFEMGKLTSGQAVQLACVGRQEFLLGCRQWGVDSVNWDADEIEAEFTTQAPILPRL